MSKIIGIDLGTTFSVAAVRIGNETKIIPNLEGSHTTPSVVALDGGTRLVGRAAKAQAALNPTRTIASAKRLIGRRRSETGPEEKMLPYSVVGAPDELAQIEVDGTRYFPQQISAMVLQDLKKSAEAYLNEPVTEAVITCPAWFNDAQRMATKEAGEIAGLIVRRVINEPTAAALAFGLGDLKDQKILVADLGGGTLDYSLLDLGSGVFEVLGTNGDARLGGDDWDKAVLDFVAADFKARTDIDVRRDPQARQRLLEACEKAKCDLSSMPQTMINVPYIAQDATGPKHLTFNLTRAKFEEVCEPLFQRCRTPAMQVLKDANLDISQINEVVLVGGSSRMPAFQRLCRELFGREPNKGVHADEAVAVGAAIQGAILSKDKDAGVRDIVLLDVTPLDLGVETLGGVMTTLIPRNSSIPTSKVETFSTASDGQPAVDIHVLQGQRRMAADNRALGRFTLTGIPAAPRGVPQIDVTFAIDANGILSVSARDKNSNREHKIDIKGSSGLDRTQISQMVEDAAAHAEDDKQRAALAEAQNVASQKAHAAEKVFHEFSGKLSKGTVEAMQSALQGARQAAEGHSLEACEKATYTLGLIVNKMTDELSAARKAEATVQQGQQDAGIPPPPPTTQQGIPPMPKETTIPPVPVQAGGRTADTAL